MNTVIEGRVIDPYTGRAATGCGVEERGGTESTPVSASIAIAAEVLVFGPSPAR